MNHDVVVPGRRLHMVGTTARPLSSAGRRRARQSHTWLCLVASCLLGACSSASPGGSSAASAVPQVTAPPSPIAVASASPGAVRCLGVGAGSSGAISLTVNGQQRGASVHIPAGLRPGHESPVILMFHGYRDTAEAAEAMTGLSDKADRAEFIVVYPQAAGEPSKWDVSGDYDIAFIRSLITTVTAESCVDRSRIYVAGISMGGGMANIAGCRLADQIAAVASVSGVYGPNWGDPCRPTRPVPIVAFHGVIDPIVPYAGGPIVDSDNGEIPDLPPVIAVEEWAAAWAQRNGCKRSAKAEAPIGKVQPMFWVSCAAPVHLYRIADGGHSWPGSSWNEPMTNRDISATDLIWDFVSQFALPPP